jgi:hypothetical protein
MDLWLCLNDIVFHRPKDEYLDSHGVLQSVAAHCTDIEPPSNLRNLYCLVFRIIETWKDDEEAERYRKLVEDSLRECVRRGLEVSRVFDFMINPPPEVRAKLPEVIANHKRRRPLPSEILTARKDELLAARQVETSATPRHSALDRQSAEPDWSPVSEASAQRNLAQGSAHIPGEQPMAGKLHEARAVDSAKKLKRSTGRGDGRAKLVSALTEHHEYADGGCLNQEPIGNNALARAAVVSKSTASAFFRGKFQGHDKYKALCRDTTRLVAALKLLNGEYAPHCLYGPRPADEDDRDDE